MELDRRTFLNAALLAPMTGELLEITSIGQGLVEETGEPPIAGAKWYSATEPGAGFTCKFKPGALAGQKWLAADFLLDGNHLMVFTIEMQEGDAGRRFRLTFAGLNQCSFRFRMSMGLTDQNRWQANREGAFLKPLVGGDRVDLAKVDRLTFKLMRKAPGKARWAMTKFSASADEPQKLAAPLLPKGPLLDELGQSRLHDWPGKTKSVGEMTTHIRGQLAKAATQSWPNSFTRWGGWKAAKIGEATGFFGVKKEGGRWWLTDPDGYAFWSAGADCVRVDTTARIDGIEGALSFRPPATGEFSAIYSGDAQRGATFVNYLAANFIRAFGAESWRERWATVALAELKRLRFNTVANWSEWEYAARARFPYVRPMSFRGSRSSMIYRDFPDIFHEGFEADAAEYASQLESTRSDPAFIGYFLMNEPTWGFSSELPAAGMLYTNEGCATRDALAVSLRMKYSGSSEALSKAWGMAVTLEGVAKGRWREPLSKAALADLRAFSVTMVERYFRILSGACKKADPNHLNLGMRWAGVPPDWAVEGMKTFDVFSLNCYMDKLPRETSEQVNKMLNMPVMIGEWHFGALDAGLPGSGIGHVKTQAARGDAYRVYFDDAAQNPNCVGAHWFTLYDQSAIGRFDGENYNIGFLDICNRPYPEICAAATASHERMYEVAMGKQAPFANVPEYLPKLFL